MSSLIEEMKSASPEELLEMLEELEIKYKQVQNDLDVTNNEKNENALKYLELMSEIEDKNKELSELKDNLQTLVDEQTAELLKTNEAILKEIDVRKEFQQQAEQMAEEAKKANAAKSEFLANMSHEIRTPLNAIINMTKITLETDLTQKQRAHLQTVKDSSYHLLTVINDILDFSKIEAGKLDIENRDFDLYQLLTSTEKTMKAGAESKNIYLKINYEPDVPQILLGDENRLRQILINLIGNSIKFTSEGGITVSVQNVSPDDSAIKLRFSIRDTGIGIPETRQKAIFDYFSQVDSSISRRFGGTGLGLAISKSLVKMMNGEIWVESQEGEGSCFYFTISLTRGNSIHIKTTETSKLRLSLKSLQVLLAEDNKVNAEIASHFLNQMGHNVVIAVDGQQAIDKLQAEHFDLVLMDVEMPICDGFEATRRIRKGAAGDAKKDITIIAMTAHAISGFKEKCIENGMNEYLTKPVDAKKLADVISGFYDTINNNHIPSATDSEPDLSSYEVKKRPPNPSELTSEERKKHLDTESALKLYNGNEELIKILAGVYLKETPTIIETILSANAEHNYDVISMNAHSLKSSSAAIGAEATSKLASQLEKAARDQQKEQTEKLVHELNEEFSLLKCLLEEI